MNRREILKILGLSTCGAAGAALGQDASVRYFPYVNEYDHIVYGLPGFTATTCRECPAGCGMLVKIYDGRPVKVEGHPDHPVNRGGLCALGQASLQALYHPRRFPGPFRRDSSGRTDPLAWDEAISQIAVFLADMTRAGRRRNIAWVSGAIGPTMLRAVERLVGDLASNPVESGIYMFEPLGLEAWRTANHMDFGRAEVPVLAFEKAGSVVSIGGDFLEAGPSRVEHARRLADARAHWGRGGMRFTHFGPRMSLTAANADRWVPINPGTEAIVAAALLYAVENISSDGTGAWKGPNISEAGTDFKVIEQVAREMVQNRPGLALSGSMLTTAPVETWGLVNRLNDRGGALNQTLIFGGGHGAKWAADSDLAALCDRMEGGEIDALFIHDFDPARLPIGERFLAAAQKPGLRVLLSSRPDGAVEAANLVLPGHHFLEQWNDYEPRAGVLGLVQPAMRPLHDTMHPGDVLLSIAAKLAPAPAPAVDDVYGPPRADQAPAPEPFPDRFLDLLEQSLRTGYALDAKAWQQAREQGGIWSEAKTVTVSPAQTPINLDFISSIRAGTLAPFASILHFDGRGADLPWLQEIADPIAKIAYDPWIELSPATAKQMGVDTGEVVKVSTERGAAEWPVRITRGIKDGVFGVPLSPLPPGASVALVRSGGRVTVVAAGSRVKLPFLQNVEDDHQRGVVRYDDYTPIAADLEHWKEENDRTKPPGDNMYEEHKYPGHKWGMVIDLDRCVGCNACVAACYAENNIPVVGRSLTLERRELAWLRVDRFYEDAPGGGLRALLAPVPCQHCDNAPCESVCPVFATLHTYEGINAQVYNRCIGTRFCSNNCPYKVRRFNWFTYWWEKPLHLQLNPEVTTREKGVMEKCSFCIQRIMAAKQKAKLDHKKYADGDARPACAQSCPARAITFGDLNDPASQVARLRRDARVYTIFPDLNTRPAVAYLTRTARK